MVGSSTRSSSSRTSKRAKTIGSKRSNDDSDLQTSRFQAWQPSSTAWSRRRLPSDGVPTLSSLCIIAFALNLQTMSSDPRVWGRVKQRLASIPDVFVPRIFEVLRRICPEALSHGFIVAVRMGSLSIRLSHDAFFVC